jgi:hypothetical protein
MSKGLKAGDRVRLTRCNAVPGYRPGDRGVVLAGPVASRAGDIYYIVRMDQDLPALRVVFAAGEIEPDV